jgi:hypothetical protein
MAYPQELWEYCVIEYFRLELPEASEFISKLRNKLQTRFHEDHIKSGYIPMLSWYGGICEFCHGYTPSDKEIIAEACQIEIFAQYFNQIKEDFMAVNIFLRRMTRCGTGLEDYQNILSLPMNLEQIINLVFDKIRDTY